jgi:hypothetical protein
MFIIVKRLNAGITVADLASSVKPELKGGLFRKTAELKSVKIVVLVDKQGVIIERHGLITITPDSEKNRLIKALQSSCIGKEKLAVAEYNIRHWSNDKRAFDAFSTPHPQNRRTYDRRRPGFRIHDRRACDAFANPHPQNLRKRDRRRSGLRIFTLNEDLDFNLSRLNPVSP